MNKFRNIAGGGYDSRKEARVHAELELRKHAAIPALRVVTIERQVRFELLPRQNNEEGKLIERMVTYIADFVVQYADGRREVIDVKSEITRKLPAYVLKRKLMLFRHGLRIVEM
jgi:hypothetical protein